jgi:hypothetical protein
MFHQMKYFEIWRLSVFLDENRFFFRFENAHQFLYLIDGAFFDFILIHVWQRFKDGFNIEHFLVNHWVNLLFGVVIIASEW